MLNPLAIGVTVGGLLLDVIVPRPKPRIGVPNESTLLSQTADSRTSWQPTADVGYHGPPVASGSLPGGLRVRRAASPTPGL